MPSKAAGIGGLILALVLVRGVVDTSTSLQDFVPSQSKRKLVVLGKCAKVHSRGSGSGLERQLGLLCEVRSSFLFLG